jgi:hypothetical protein
MAAPQTNRWGWGWCWGWGWPAGAQPLSLGTVEIEGTLPQTLQHVSAKLQRVPVNQRPVEGLRRQLLQRRGFGSTAALGVGQGAGFNRMVELLQTAPQISL